MQKYSFREFEDDCRVCGKFNNSPLPIARAVRKEVSSHETEHYHKNCYEYYLFLSGKAEMQINGNSIEVKKGDVILIEPDEEHKITKISEELDYITIRSSNDDDKIITEDAKNV